MKEVETTEKISALLACERKNRSKHVDGALVRETRAVFIALKRAMKLPLVVAAAVWFGGFKRRLERKLG